MSVIATVIERADRDEDVRRIREAMFGRTGERVAEALAAAVERGEFRPGIEDHATELASHILGPLYFHRFTGVPWS
ncbi:TetR/AcrR family transcriptional regulator C-terminal ligand-binding domain-containing protein [Streptomyces griseorubiginosus]|uniref:TetR/AcrR family transcriptional regulator C-terminal ligand-binding domain-containing protein n=1 Tax=Streptomyces griseorubiginosus TaxID=67304 RepID=UPI0036946C7C